MGSSGLPYNRESGDDKCLPLPKITETVEAGPQASHIKVLTPEIGVAVKVLVDQSCLTLGDPMDCSWPGSFDHGILQARIVEWVAMPSSRGLSQPRN